MRYDSEKEAFGMFLIEAIAEPLGLPLDTRAIDRAVYKGTECGAWVSFDETGILVGSIVEGSEAEFSERIDLNGIDISDEGAAELNRRFWAAIERINEAACEAWQEANQE